MKYLVYLVIGFFVFCFTANSSFGQDAFKRKSKKGPNIYSEKKPRTKSRTKQYRNSTSKKKSKRKNAIFSSKKKRYGSTIGGSKGGKEKAGKNSSGGRKSGKGRKKEK